ncbi:MAG: hypothetical protein SFY66_14330 [Oculatellaceae cyanobacterium bins.114]|nr:hypothetical protein [Oculatellaceae cyanobacterium bins.114]
MQLHSNRVLPGSAPDPLSVAERIDTLDWSAILETLDRQGFQLSTPC